MSGPRNSQTCRFEPLLLTGGALGTGTRQHFDANFAAADYKGTYRYRVTAVNQAGNATAVEAQVTLK